MRSGLGVDQQHIGFCGGDDRHERATDLKLG